ncbi:MAG TPA: type II toxin-antitoxin system prevent-host-death family antitoxin [Vicinamibacteria bacterium]|nr:type II toxin-antitoxin system prevent-host-death family antitoxin [Vicinamibacteria bacterium]
MKLRQNLGDLLNEVQYRNGRILITKAGKPVAALVDVALFERIQKLDAQFEQLADRLAKVFDAVPAEEAEAWLDEAVRTAREKSADQ